MQVTAGALLGRATARLAAAGVPDARRDALLLLTEATGLDRAAIITRPEQSVDEAAARRFADMVSRREAREPVSLILGVREFWSLPFRVTAATLTPRPDTETLVDAVLAALPDRQKPYHFLDLGTGTGCLVAALLTEYPHATGVGVDISPAAAAVAAANLAALGLARRSAVVVADWTAAIKPGTLFDVIVCNPPYVESGADLPWEVARFDPAMALYAGPDGLAAYGRLIPLSIPHLAPGGSLVLELGWGQAAAVSDIARAAGLTRQQARADLAGIPRVLVLRITET